MFQKEVGRRGGGKGNQGILLKPHEGGGGYSKLRTKGPVAATISFSLGSKEAPVYLRGKEEQRGGGRRFVSCKLPRRTKY